ncbi:MAG: tripartite tricarboxylate transporter substrate binding protein [Burkholderiales bacterium]|jgi:tripartite-type tricarboxylate transporter receptor subunit TctC|nr:tripartite tricarboxylate transporter substrate binding protein [Burkholderiales bacterium]
MNVRVHAAALPAAAAALSLSCAVLSTATHAQPAWPAKPVRLLVPFSAGGVTDLLARSVAQRLGEGIGQSVVVDNRPGANTIIAYEILGRAGADGYTLMLEGFNGLVLNPLLYPKLPYSPDKDIAPVGLIGFSPVMVVVNPQLPVKSIRELVDYARANPGKLNFGSSGIGGVVHISTEWFMALTGTRMTHVPYKGGASALPDLMAGQLQVLFNPPITAIPMVKAGKLRALAVSSSKRLSAMPDVPTVAELGYPGYDAATWFSLLARRGSPQAIIDRLSAELKKVVDTPALREQFAAQAIEFQWGDSTAVAALVKKDLARWGEVIRKGNIKVDPLQ